MVAFFNESTSFLKIKQGKKVKFCKGGLLNFISYIFVSFSSTEKILTKAN